MLGCPRCNAPLDKVKDADGSITCQYCSAQCRISTKTHAKAGHKDAPVKTWWLYFDAPSKQRKKLLNEAKQQGKRDRKQASERAMAQHVANRDEAAVAAAKQRIYGSSPEPPPPDPSKGGSMATAIILLVLIAAGAAAAVWFLVLKK
jgi:hypothetical protein